jgi:hypothetical protein
MVFKSPWLGTVPFLVHQTHSSIYNRAAKPKRAAPATPAPVKPVGKAAAAFPLAPEAETEAEPEEAALVAEAMADDAWEAAEPAWLVALLKALPAWLEALDRMELAAEFNEDREDAAPVELAAAAELRLERLLWRAEVTELKLDPMEDSTELADKDAEAADSEAAEVTDDRELLTDEMAEEASEEEADEAEEAELSDEETLAL